MGLVLESVLVEVIIFLASVFTLGYFYVQHLFSYWDRNNVKCLKPSFPFGTFRKLFLAQMSLTDFLQHIYENTREDFIGLYAMFRPILFVKSPEIARMMLIKDFQYFHDRGLYVNEKVDPLSSHLFSLSGEQWKQLRVKLTPTFTSGKLKAMFPTLIQTGIGLQKFLSKEADRMAELDMKDLMGRHTTNNIASIAFGIEVDSISEPNHKFRENGKKPFAPTLKNGLRNALFMLLPRVAEIIKMKTVDDDYEEFIFQVVTQTINHREQNNIQRKDFMQLLLQLRNTGKVDTGDDFSFASSTEGAKKLTINEMAAQAHVFFLAGFETSSTLMSFCLYELARHPDVQKKLQEELDQVLQKHNGKWSYDAMVELKYLESCLDETLRMYPPVPVLNRACNANYVIPGTNTIIEKGTAVFIPVAGLHYDPQYFKDPKTFRPERFYHGEVNTSSPYNLPFGDGPRVCIGMRLGKMQAKIGMAMIMEKFNMELGEILQKNSLKFAPESIVPTPITGLPLRVSHRK
ncbi:hypothetical protein DMENIID0001_152640 [Sergentomyia squamirostris]